jgi:RNA polymerase sigma-70 factor, ECF subfamily
LASFQFMLESDRRDEQNLIARALDGELEAFNLLVDRYQAVVYRVCLRVLGDSGRAEDVTQETFIRVYDALGQYQGGSFKSWILRIATNRCYDLLRSERRRPSTSLDALPFESEPTWSVEPTAEHPDAFATRSQLSSFLERALQQLSDDQRVAIVLYDVQGYSYEEIAGITDASLGTVKSRISRGRVRLRQILNEDERARELFDGFRRQSEDGTT